MYRIYIKDLGEGKTLELEINEDNSANIDCKLRGKTVQSVGVQASEGNSAISYWFYEMARRFSNDARFA